MTAKEKEYKWTGKWVKINYIGWCASIKVKFGDCPRPGDIMRVFKRCGEKYNDVVLVEYKLNDNYSGYEYWKVDDNKERVKLAKTPINNPSFGAGQHPIDPSIKAYCDIVDAIHYTMASYQTKKESKTMNEMPKTPNNPRIKYIVIVYRNGLFVDSWPNLPTEEKAIEWVENYLKIQPEGFNYEAFISQTIIVSEIDKRPKNPVTTTRYR